MKRLAIRMVIGAYRNSASKFPIKVVFSNGSTYQNLPGKPQVTLVFKNNRAEWRTFFFDYVGFMESFREGDIDIEGEDAVRKLIRMCYELTPSTRASGFTNPLNAIRYAWQEWRRNNKRYLQEKANLYHHYNLPAEFFHIMTGELYGYTEGYFETGKETQNEAQYKKYEYMCRKLCLKKGDKLVEVGTAWGTLALMAAKKYGAEVVNYGIVKGQNRVLRERIARMGLQGRIVTQERDARELRHERERYDKYVSLGVFEHAGKDAQRDWIESIAACLKQGGIGVITFTGHMRHRPMDYLISKYVWFGCHLPSLAETLQYMEDNELNVVDVENARFHYADTMEMMLRNMHEHWPEIRKINPRIFDERFKRIWTVYYLGAIEAFRAEHKTFHAFQLVFVKGRKDVYPRTRKFLYRKKFDTSDMQEYEVPHTASHARSEPREEEMPAQVKKLLKKDVPVSA